MAALKNHAFKDVALTLTGNEVVCTIDGTVSYAPANDGEDPEIDDIALRTESNAMVYVERSEPMWQPIRRAVARHLRNLPSERTPVDNEAA